MYSLITSSLSKLVKLSQISSPWLNIYLIVSNTADCHGEGQIIDCSQAFGADHNVITVSFHLTQTLQAGQVFDNGFTDAQGLIGWDRKQSLEEIEAFPAVW